MMVEEILENADEQMKKSTEFCKSQFAKVRTGRASTSLIDGVMVELYGAKSPISQGATISVPDPRTILIQPWDRSTLAAIEKAIQQADLGFNPQSDGNVIRIPVPPLTEERRLEFVKMCKKFAEEGKIAVRNIRREYIEILKKGEKNNEFAEDDRKWGEDEVQSLTDKYVKLIDQHLVGKEKELMED